MKTCTKCRQRLPKSEFGVDANAKDGLFYWCRPCARASSRAYYWRNAEARRSKARNDYWDKPDFYKMKARKRRATHPEEARAASKRWRAKNKGAALEHSNKRRALLLNAPEVEAIDRDYIYVRDGGRCHICGKHVDRSIPRNYTLDHLVPLSRGGAHTPQNLRVAHHECNSRRGAGRTPAQLLLIG